MNKKEYNFNDICDEFEKQLGPGSRYDMKVIIYYKLSTYANT